jgi:hypothetical protein
LTFTFLFTLVNFVNLIGDHYRDIMVSGVRESLWKHNDFPSERPPSPDLVGVIPDEDSIYGEDSIFGADSTAIWLFRARHRHDRFPPAGRRSGGSGEDQQQQ